MHLSLGIGGWRLPLPMPFNLINVLFGGKSQDK